MFLDRLGMIVIHGGRYFSRVSELGLRRAEFAIIASKHSKGLKDFIDSERIPFSAHCPMIAPDDYHENPLLGAVIDFDEDRRLAARKMMIHSMEQAADLGAEFAVAHLQRPEIFGGKNPDGATEEQALDIAKEGCEILLKHSERLNLPLNVENLMDNSLFNSAESYAALFDEFHNLGFCLDLGHLEVDSRKFGFSLDAFIDATLPYIRSVHLQNSEPDKLDFKSRHWKAPVHPAQDVTQGWMDIEMILGKILGANRECVINFESRQDEIYDFEYTKEGVEWVKGMLPRIISNGGAQK